MRKIYYNLGINHGKQRKGDEKNGAKLQRT